MMLLHIQNALRGEILTTSSNVNVYSYTAFASLEYSL